MFACILWFSAVICITYSSMAQRTIVDEMREELRKCPFPPAEDLKQGSQGGILTLCAVTEPLLDEKLPNYDLKFSFGKYLCMELFDLSLQLCSQNISEDKFPTSEDFLGKIPLSQNVSTFCEKLQFSDNYAKKTRPWASIAVDTLKNRTLCETHCIIQNNLNPVCGAIAWANNLLLSLSPPQQSVEKTDSQVVVPPNQEHEIGEFKGEVASQPTTKEEVIPRTSNTSVIENKTAPNKFNEIGRVESVEMTSKRLGINTNPETFIKNVVVDSPTQSPMGTSTVVSVKEEAEKDDDREDDSVRSPVMVHGDPLVEFNKISSDDELGNVEPKGSSVDVNPQEGYGEEDAPSRGNSADGLPIDSRVYHDTFVDAQDSHFFAYFLTMVVICIIGYLVFHNKQKIIALALEGRRMQGSRRRPNTSSYKKLDSNLEEAVTSNCSSSSVTHIIF
ncbi:trans-Golgi network integral membrane protein 1-like [Hetaerina americana]|uniref:trans-Golgi network integral membrane protein 1-like n=1 Tax=Hetaerina americana TaxID=62018 RepID=UPI003A7F16D8